LLWQLDGVLSALYLFVTPMTRTVTLIYWRLLTAWMLSTLSGQWLRVHARQCSVTLRKSDV